MESQTTEKVDISRILIHAVDGLASTARVTSMEAANSVLQSWALDQSAALPAECEVEIVFEDGLRYHAHYLLKDQEKNVSLGRHVRRQLTALTKAKCLKRNEHPANEPSIEPNGKTPVERAMAILERYNI